MDNIGSLALILPLSLDRLKRFESGRNNGERSYGVTWISRVKF